MFNNLIKKILVAATAAALTITSVIPSNIGTLNVNAASDVTVNLNSTKQTIQGIGGMNHPIWISDLTSAQVETAFGNGENQLGFNILRIHVDENKSNWSREVATAKAAAAKGALVFASPWNPPSSMTENSSNGKRLKYSSYDAYVNHLNDFVSYMKQNGVELYAISIQNEPDYAHEWTAWTPTEIANFMKNYAGKINCRVMAPESFQYVKRMSDPILNDAGALANMDILGAHFYGTQRSQMSYPLFKQKGAGKELWMTEVYVPDSTSSADAWPNALNVAVNMNDAFAVGDFQAYVWWYIRRSYGPMKENGQISKRGYCMAQFSKFIRRGYQRVDATYNPNTNVFVSAYKGDGKAVIVAVNNSDTTYTQKFNVSGGSIKSVDRYRTSSNESLAKTANISTSSSSFNAQLPARSVSTFVCDLGNGSSVQPTQAPTQQPTQAPTQQPWTQQPTVAPTQAPVAVTSVSDGWYYIKSVSSQKYLTVNGTSAGANVEIRTGNGGENQKWKVTSTGDGYFTLTSGVGNFMMDVAYGKDEDGANIGIYNAYSGEAQRYVAQKTNTDGVFTIGTKASNGNKVLDVYQKKTADGTNIIQWTRSGSANQQFIFEAVNGQQPTVAPTVAPTQAPTTSGKLEVGYTINSWGSGYQVSYKVSNKSNAAVSTWTLKVKKSDCKISNSWNVNVKESGDYYIITPVSWNSQIPVGGSVEFGILGEGSIGSTINCSVE